MKSCSSLFDRIPGIFTEFRIPVILKIPVIFNHQSISNLPPPIRNAAFTEPSFIELPGQPDIIRVIRLIFDTIRGCHLDLNPFCQHFEPGPV